MDKRVTVDTFELEVRQIRLEAEAIASYELVGIDGAPLPRFAAGAHVDLHLPGGLVRSYSLVNDPAETDRYLIAVQRAEPGRGGSAWMHAVPRVGDRLRVSGPANDFALADTQAFSLLIAGGIGITPLLSMARTLHRLGRRWALHYAARSPRQAAFVGALAALRGPSASVSTCFGSDRGSRLDLRRLVDDAPPEAHLYCCGPSRMIDEFIDACASRPAATVHVERFGASAAAATEGGFELWLERSGRRIEVGLGRSILETLLDHGVAVQYACMAGVCGTCRTPVVAGEPDHRDGFLTDEERRANRSIMICCSGSRSRTLVLDL